MIRIHRLLGRTIVLVTHDIDEALQLADRLVLMDSGAIVQQGTPLEMLTRPATPFVRDFWSQRVGGSSAFIAPCQRLDAAGAKRWPGNHCGGI